MSDAIKAALAEADSLRALAVALEAEADARAQLATDLRTKADEVERAAREGRDGP